MAILTVEQMVSKLVVHLVVSKVVQLAVWMDATKDGCWVVSLVAMLADRMGPKMVELSAEYSVA